MILVKNEREIEAVVGENVRRIRMDLGLTLNDVSVQLRALGLPWSTGRLGDIEAGRGTASVKVVLVLAVALTAAQRGPGGQPVTPGQLLASETPVAVSSKFVLTPEGFERVLGGSGHLAPQDIVGGQERAREAGQRLMAWAQSMPKGITVGQTQAAYDHYGLADARAAKRLGLEKDDFIRRCLALWGRVLSDETEARAPEGATPQRKGAITRALVAELQEAMSDGHA